MIGKTRLKIAFIADTIHSGKAGGGVVSARHVIEKLREHHDVLEVATDAEGPGRVHGYSLPLRAYREAEFVIARPERDTLEPIIGAADVVHLQFPFFLSYAALRLARDWGKPVVAAFHVQPENALLNIGVHGDWANDAAYRWWVRSFYNHADAVVCPTPFAEQKLREHGLVVPTLVISNGITPDVRPTGEAREAPYEGFILILTAGRFAPEKHQEVLLQAVHRSRHRERIKLVLAGSGARGEALAALARDLPNAPEIGFLPRERLVRLLNTADLFVHCSAVELEGMAVLEALSVGLPAVVAQSPQSAASAFALDPDFQFPAGDAAALAERIDQLIEHPERLARARERSMALARRFDFGAGVAALADLYRSLVGGQLPRGQRNLLKSQAPGVAR